MPDYKSKRKLKKERLRTEGRRFSYITSESVPNTQKKPAFSFDYLQDSHCITLCDDSDQLAFVNALRKLSKLTWNQIRSTQRHGLGSEKIYRRSFQVPIPAIIGEDITFIAIRFSGFKSMIGYQEDRIFQIVWFDRDFNVYKHGD